MYIVRTDYKAEVFNDFMEAVEYFNMLVKEGCRVMAEEVRTLEEKKVVLWSM